MAERELSILVKAKGALEAARNIGKVDSSIGKLGSTAAQGVKTAARTVAGVGLIVAGGIAAAVKTGLDDLATLESAVTSVQGAIKATGQTGKVSAQDVAGWANEIEAKVGAAFDDKDIVSATATLIRFGHVTPQNLRPAMQVMTDLAAKTGSVESAANLLSKALADPTKAAGKLTKVGVVLSAQQQEQLKSLGKLSKEEEAHFKQLQKKNKAQAEQYKSTTLANKALKAQDFVLDAIADTTKGAAAASQGPYQRALSLLADVSEDARKALAEGFLPVIEKTANLLSTQLAKPEVIQGLRDFGKGLAGGLDQAISIAQKIPWSSVGDAMRVAGTGAKAALDFFTGLPPWVQTAVLTGWGLNKLTGGAVGSIVGQLGSGLIKGVLGMNAGVVNINAGVVNGPGGVGGKGGPGIGAAGGLLGPGLGAAATVIGGAAAMNTVIPELFRGAPGSGIVGSRGGASQQTRQQFAALMPSFERFLSKGEERFGPPRPSMSFREKGFLDQRAGERGGAVHTAIERERMALEKFDRSASPSLRSMDAHMVRLRQLQESEGPRSAAFNAQITAAIDRLASIMRNPVPVNVTVPIRTITNNQVRYIRVSNHAPGRGPTID